MKKILVNFFLWYLRTLSKIQLKKIKPLIIGIGGASGKSSLAEISSFVLSSKYKVKQSKGKNSETGIPLNILDIEINDYSFKNWLKIFFLAPFKILSNWKKYDIYVVEMGIDSPKPPKNMSYLLSFIKPRIAILTNIYLEHSEYFDTLSESDNSKDRKEDILGKIADQEKLLLTSIEKSGRAIVNLDDEYIKSVLPLSSKTLTVSSKNQDADFYISKVIISQDSFKVNFVFLKESYELNVLTPLPKYYAHIFIFAIAIAFSNEINIKDSISFIENNFSLPPGRFTVLKGIKNSTIFDSSYNSSLEAAIGAMEVLKEIGKEGNRKVAVLGDMRELGSLSQIQHEILAREIIKNLDLAVLIGPQMKEFAAPILTKANFEFEAFDSFKNAKEYVLNMVRRGDLILVKGSQNTLFLERAVEILLLEKSDRDKLARRGKYWDKQRQKSG